MFCRSSPHDVKISSKIDQLFKYATIFLFFILAVIFNLQLKSTAKLYTANCTFQNTKVLSNMSIMFNNMFPIFYCVKIFTSRMKANCAQACFFILVGKCNGMEVLYTYSLNLHPFLFLQSCKVLHKENSTTDLKLH